MGLKVAYKRAPPRMMPARLWHQDIREWAGDRQGFELYITVVATNVGRRQNTVVAMGLRLESEGRK